MHSGSRATVDSLPTCRRRTWYELLDRRIELELAVGWLASQQCVASVIAGATRPEQVAADVEAGSWRLAPEQLARVDEITRR